jgi:excisionase family DNA binding protein
VNLDSLTAVEVAKLLDVTEKTVRNWMNDNGLPSKKVGRGRTVEWREALKWFVAYSGGNDGNGVRNPVPEAEPEPAESYDVALARKTRAEADLKELQLAKERGQVAAIGDVERVLAASCRATQTQILAIPSRLATRLLGIEDHGTAVRILEAELRQVLTNLATIDAVREAAGVSAEDDE